MKSIKYILCIFLILSISQLYSQQKKVLVFDPMEVSGNFQSAFAQLSDDSIFVADTIDENIHNYDALFLFTLHPFTQIESDRLIAYSAESKPIYTLFSYIDSVSFWNHIGITGFAGLALSVPIDSVIGNNSEFTKNVVIDTSFMSGYIPVVSGYIDSILIGIGDGWKVNTTYNSEIDSLNVIVDLYNLIHHHEFLEKVIEYFGLNTFPKITVNVPNGGEHWLMGDIRELTWESNKVDSVKIELSLHNSLIWYTVVESTPSDGIYEWLVQAPQTSWECRIKITDINDSTVKDESDDFFVIDIFPSVDDSTNVLIPDRFELFQNYPNPFNPTTTIKFTIPSVIASGAKQSQLVTLKVYDVLGNEIATLVNEEKSAGEYEVDFNIHSREGGNLTSGIYFYKLQAGEYIETKKMVLMK